MCNSGNPSDLGEAVLGEGSGRMAELDFEALFESSPGAVLVLAPDPPRFTIVAATDAYVRSTGTDRASVVGRGIFDVFPDNPEDPRATGVANLRASLNRVVASHHRDEMLVQRYDIRLPDVDGARFEERHWRPVNIPVLGSDGALRYILHQVDEVTELVRARQVADENRLHTVLTDQVTEYAIYMLDPTGHVLTWNAGAERLKGYSANEIVGQYFARFFPQEDVDAGTPTEMLERARATGEAQLEGWRVRKDGSRFWADVVLTRIQDHEGRVTGFAKVTRDLTERKRNLDQLHRWQHLFEHARWGVAVIDAELHRLDMINPAFARMHGYTPEELKGKPLSDLIAPEYRARSVRHLRRVVEAEHDNFEIVHQRSDGTRFPVLVDASAAKAEDGLLIYEAISVLDITERKRAETEQRFLSQVGATLASSLDYEETLATVIQLAVPVLADCCIIDVLDEGGTVRRSKVVHVDPEMSLLAASIENLPTGTLVPIRHALEERRSVVHAELWQEDLPLLSEDERTLALLRELDPTSFVAVPLLARQKVLGAIAFMNVAGARPVRTMNPSLADELARRAALSVDSAQLYSAARQAIQARDEVLGVVAHDLRNPINSISLSAQVISRSMEKKGSPPERLAALAGSIRQSAMMADRLIQDLLDIARIEANRLVLDRQFCPASTVVTQALDLMRPGAESASVELSGPRDSSLPMIYVDQTRILQVFSNLIGNAIKFTPEGGRITVGAQPRDRDLVFSVSDTGPGIPPEQLPHLFDRFWQAHSSDRRGAGLGLAIAKSIVEAHGGKISVQSTVGEGTTFFICLPAPDHHERQASCSSGSTSDLH